MGAEMLRHKYETIGTVTEGGVTLEDDVCLSGRALLLGILTGVLQLAASGTIARASAIAPSEIQITLPGAIKWTT